MAFQVECRLPWQTHKGKVQPREDDVIIDETVELTKCKIKLQLPHYSTNITEMTCKPVLLYKKLSLKFRPIRYFASMHRTSDLFDAIVDDVPGSFSFYPIEDSYLCKYSNLSTNPWFVPPHKIYRAFPKDYETIGFFRPMETSEYCLRCYRLKHTSANCREKRIKNLQFKVPMVYLDDDELQSRAKCSITPFRVERLLFRFLDGITLLLPHISRILSPGGCPVLSKTWNTGLHNLELARAGEDLRQHLNISPRFDSQLVREPDNRKNSEWLNLTVRRNYGQEYGHCRTPHRSVDPGLGITQPKQIDNEFENHLKTVEDYQKFMRPILEANPGTHKTSSISALDMHDTLEKHRRAGLTLPRKSERRAALLHRHDDIDSLFTIRKWIPDNLPISANADPTTDPIDSVFADGGSAASAEKCPAATKTKTAPLKSTKHLIKEYRVLLTTDQRDELFLRPCGIHVRKIADTTLSDHFFTGKSAEEEQREEFSAWNTSTPAAVAPAVTQLPCAAITPHQTSIPPPKLVQKQETVTLGTLQQHQHQFAVQWGNPPQFYCPGTIPVSPPLVQLYQADINSMLPTQPKLRAISSTQTNPMTPLLIDTGASHNLLSTSRTRDPLLSQTIKHSRSKFERLASESPETSDENQEKDSVMTSATEYQPLVDQDYDEADI